MEGLSLLRDKGLRYNPRDAFIHLDISRIFMEKIGDKKDKWYALRWAWIMRQYLPNGDRGDINRLLKAATSKEELRKREGVHTIRKCITRQIDQLIFTIAQFHPAGSLWMRSLQSGGLIHDFVDPHSGEFMNTDFGLNSVVNHEINCFIINI